MIRFSPYFILWTARVIYFIECNTCRLQYSGKSETGFNLRLNNHRNHIKKGVNSCELTEHFLHNVRSHNFDNDVTITVIEQIRKDHLTIDRKKELLRNREMFWQRMLNLIQPNGLKKRTRFYKVLGTENVNNIRCN